MAFFGLMSSKSVPIWTSGIPESQQLPKGSGTPEWSPHHGLVPTSEKAGRFLPLALKGNSATTFPILGFNQGFDLQVMREMLLGSSHWAIFRAWHWSGKRELACDTTAHCRAGLYISPVVNIGHFLLWVSRSRQPQKHWRQQMQRLLIDAFNFLKKWRFFLSSHSLSSPMLWNQISKQHIYVVTGNTTEAKFWNQKTELWRRSEPLKLAKPYCVFNFYLDVSSLLLTHEEKAKLSKCHSSTSPCSHALGFRVPAEGSGCRRLWEDFSSFSCPCSMTLVMEDTIKCLHPGLLCKPES